MSWDLPGWPLSKSLRSVPVPAADRRLEFGFGCSCLVLLPGATAMLIVVVATAFAQWLLVPAPIWVRVPLCVTAGAVTSGAYVGQFHRTWLIDRLRLLRGRESI